MASEISTFQWIEILQDKTLTKETNISIFQILYDFDDQKAYASQIGRIMGSNSKVPHGTINLEIGRYAKRIGKKYDINYTERSKSTYKYWDLFFNGWDEGKFFVWQLKEPLKKALEETELTGEEKYSEEISFDNQEKLFEGAKRKIVVNAYERNYKVRQLCIKEFGNSCAVCEFNFEEHYGELGKDFIHVHHLTPISQIGKNYEVDPTKDLRPVCPNCHSMLHRKEPPISIEELKLILKYKSE